MTQELGENEQMILNGLDELLTGVTNPCANAEAGGCEEVCDRHEGVVALIKYLTALTKSLFRQQSEIQALMKEIREGNAFLVRTRKILLWASVAVGGAFLATWGEDIYKTLKTPTAPAPITSGVVAGTP